MVNPVLTIIQRFKKSICPFSTLYRDHGISVTKMNISELQPSVTKIVTLEPVLDSETIIMDFSFDIRDQRYKT